LDYCEFNFDYSQNNEFYYGLMSDLHLDSVHFAKEKFTKDADECVNHNARILINGDVFDAIIPTDRKRYVRGSDNFNEDAQINARIEFAVKILKPYVDYIDFIGIGNHEASIVKYDGVDLVKMLVHELSLYRSKELLPIQRGSYQGFIRLWFKDKGSAVRQFVIYREHGKGGASPVTKGTINIQRLHTTFIADCYWLGHSHTSIVDSTPWTIYADNSGHIVKKQKRSVITAGYNEGFTQRNLGENDFYRNDFVEEKFLAPTGIGYAMLHITVPRSHGDMDLDVKIIN
jgi:hypothetical protein